MLTLLYGVALLLTGFAKVQWSVDMYRLKKGRWAPAAISAVITLVCSAVIISNPCPSAGILWLFTGIALTAEAIFDIVILFLGSKKAPDIAKSRKNRAPAETEKTHFGDEPVRKTVNLNLHWALGTTAIAAPVSMRESFQSPDCPRRRIAF